MKWTANVPNTTGYYWVWPDGSVEPKRNIYYVYPSIGGQYARTQMPDGGVYVRYAIELTPCKWFGPVEPPVLPKVDEQVRTLVRPIKDANGVTAVALQMTDGVSGTVVLFSSDVARQLSEKLFHAAADAEAMLLDEEEEDEFGSEF